MNISDKIHERFNEGWNSVAVIDTSAIIANLALLRSKVPSGVQQMAVVKADAYGHGAIEVSRKIESKVDFFGVANLLEGSELRESGITMPILVFGSPHRGNAHLYPKYNLTATISAPDQFDILLPGTEYHIKFDTGMGRVGIQAAFLSKTEELIVRNPQIKYTGLMTHFANSEVLGSEIFASQLEHFHKIHARLGKDVIVHVSNSGATLHQSDVHFNMIRGGTAIYGFDPSGLVNNELKPAMHWVSRLAQVRSMKAGEGVSYSHSWHLPKDGNVGVIPVGYADGLNRSLSNRISFEVNGKDYIQAGNITMDQVMIFLDDDAPEPGSLVTILGGYSRQSAYNWANILNTITYEITCLVGNRVNRLHI